MTGAHPANTGYSNGSALPVFNCSFLTKNHSRNTHATLFDNVCPTHQKQIIRLNKRKSNGGRKKKEHSLIQSISDCLLSHQGAPKSPNNSSSKWTNTLSANKRDPQTRPECQVYSATTNCSFCWSRQNLKMPTFLSTRTGRRVCGCLLLTNSLQFASIPFGASAQLSVKCKHNTHTHTHACIIQEDKQRWVSPSRFLQPFVLDKMIAVSA